jgi:hypothetical protein
MDSNVSAIERAFALAASGRFHKVSDIRLQLHREGYNHELVQGPLLSKQLAEVMQQAHHPPELLNSPELKVAVNQTQRRRPQRRRP